MNHESALPSPTSSASSSSASVNPIKDMIRRKSSELGRLMEGGAGATKRSNDGSKTNLDQVSLAAHDRGISVDSARITSPTPVPSGSISLPQSPPQSRGSRRPAFTLGLPWRPQSEYSSNGASGLQARLTKSQRKFVRAFPELADLVMVPSAYCAPCLATPPPTPTDGISLSRSTHTMSPSDTLNTITSTDSSGTMGSNTAVACPGHFNDFACALEREILWQGTLYVTATHVCFYGKHFRTTVRVMVDYRDLVFMEKEKKMGVFPSSIRLRVKKSEEEGKAGMAVSEEEDLPTGATSISTKDYVLTSLISREQAFAEIERNWNVHRQVMKNLSDNGLGPSKDDSCGHGIDTLESIALDLDSLSRSEARERRKAPRTYSVICDEAFSSTENVDRPGLRERVSSSGLRAPASVMMDPTESNGQDRVDILSSKDDDSPSESRRGSIASAASSEKQETATKLKAFLQRRQSQLRKGTKSNTSESGPDVTLEQQEVIASTGHEVAHPHSTMPGTAQTAGSSGSIRAGIQRSSTPPILISPSLTTTKVSHSSSTVQSVAQPGNIQGMTKHMHKESKETLSDKIRGCGKRSDSEASSDGNHSDQHTEESASLKAPTVVLPDGPVPCGCERHYKNTVISAVVPIPVELCFEILFSGKGAGKDDKLGCDTHRIKDGSTEIKIMPWQHGEPKDPTAAGSGMTDWENQSRHLEYSVSFKVPMLQQVTRYSPYVILVHSESRTPNVPYGEQFSTVNQICMTWEAPGKTRIQCFTEVKFKKSFMLSGKVESGSLEGSGGFYKEIVRQLQEAVEKQREQLIQSSICMAPAPCMPPSAAQTRTLDSTTVSPPLSSSTSTAMSLAAPNIVKEKTTSPTTGMSSDGAISQGNVDDQAHSASGSTTAEFSEMSRAQSLLSQQILRDASNTAAQSKAAARSSLECGRPPAEAASATGAKDHLIPTLPSEKKSAISAIMQSLTPPGFPVVTGATTGSTAESKDTAAAHGQTKQDTSAPVTTFVPIVAPVPWADIVRKGLTILGKGTLYSSTATSTSVTSGGSVVTSDSNSTAVTSTKTKTSVLLVSEDVSSSLRTGDHSGGARVKFASQSTLKSSMRSNGGGNGFAPSSSQTGNIASSHSASPSKGLYQKHGQPQVGRRGHQERQGRPFSKTVFSFVVLGLVVTALNIWYLSSIVSSMVDVVQVRLDLPQHNHHHHHHHHRDRPAHQEYYQAGSIRDGDEKKHSLDSRSSPSTPPVPLFSAMPLPYVMAEGSNESTEDQPLAPMRSETEILRAEITELFNLLEKARKELQLQQQQQSV
ncbi:Protein Aster-C [Mortierella alpina]|nr:Protein Aster-C [Mortierella alpina]